MRPFTRRRIMVETGLMWLRQKTDTLSADRQGISPGQTALPGLEGAPRTGKRRGQARTSEDEKVRKEKKKAVVKSKEKGGKIYD